MNLQKPAARPFGRAAGSFVLTWGAVQWLRV